MIVERALALAGPDAHLVTRPAGVPHVYVGPLTPSGRHVPRAGQTVCRAHTRRLSVLSRSERWSSLDPEASRVCARCAARLSRRVTGEPAPTTRDGWRTRHADTTRADLALALAVAVDLEEVAAAAHLSLVLFEYADVREPFTERGRRWPSLHQLIDQARGRFASDEERDRAKTLNAQAFDVIDASRRASREARQEREDRISRLGFTNATASEPRRRRPRRNT